MSGFEALLAGTAVAGAGASIVKGFADSKMHSEQSRVAQAQADRERLVAAAEEEDFRIAASRSAAKDRARRAASGIDPHSGTSLMVEEDVAGEAELGALRIRDTGAVRSFRLEQEARMRKRAANMAIFGGFLDAGTTLLTAATKWPKGAGSIASSDAGGIGSFAGAASASGYRTGSTGLVIGGI